MADIPFKTIDLAKDRARLIAENKELRASQNVYLKSKIKGVKMQRADLKRRLRALYIAAHKVALAFPADEDAHEFDIPFYVIQELRDALEASRRPHPQHQERK